MIGRLADRGYRGHVIVTSGVDEEPLASVEQLARDSSIPLLGCLQKPIESQPLAEMPGRLSRP